MSNEMFERVANGISVKLKALGYMKAANNYSSMLAKAAIEAMREPTQAMLDAGAYDLDISLEQQWERMINAALKDE